MGLICWRPVTYQVSRLYESECTLHLPTDHIQFWGMVSKPGEDLLHIKSSWLSNSFSCTTVIPWSPDFAVSFNGLVARRVWNCYSQNSKLRQTPLFWQTSLTIDNVQEWVISAKETTSFLSINQVASACRPGNIANPKLTISAHGPCWSWCGSDAFSRTHFYILWKQTS